ncbi:MAG TPA: FtsX-like permease family protein, partial [Candidatus Polarisedimenticolaceae bacterium]|nr:FtsX-like permease family protein [Candidatus Polarisedimenticolaceae bacterium]
WRVVRQLLTESCVLAVAGGGLGLLVAWWGVEAIRGGLPPQITRFVPGWSTMELNAGVVGFTLAVSLATGVVFGLLPALQVSRPDLVEALKDGGPGRTPGRGRGRTRGLLVAAEIALALVLLVGAALSLRGLQSLLGEQLGLRADHLLTAQIALPEAGYAQPAEITAFFDRVLANVARLPEVERADAVSNLPLSGAWEDRAFTLEGRPAPGPAEQPGAKLLAVGADYFATLGIPLVRGRTFAAADAAQAPLVVAVSESLARRFWPNEDPLGRRIKLGRADADRPWRTVVAVVRDVRHFGIDPQPAPTIYAPRTQLVRSRMTLVVRTRVEPTSLAEALRAEVLAVDPQQPIYDVRAMEQVVADAHCGPQLVLGMLVALAAVAVVLAAVGVYGVVAHGVASRTQELGVRMALGAGRGELLRLVLRQGVRPIALGWLVGLGGALAASRLLAGAMFWVRPSDPLALAGVPLLLGAVALLACWLPARRATRVDPLIALRCE